MLNNQPPEKRKHRTHSPAIDSRLDVQSIFYTIQGEGPFCGTPAVFIRLAGCNLQCPWCDTDYTSKRRYMQLGDIMAEVNGMVPHHGPALVVITGGEPFRQYLTPLLRALRDEQYYVQIETNGTLAPPADFQFNAWESDARDGVYIVCSPKAGKVHPLIAQNACAFKYVLSADSMSKDDGLPLLALDHTAQPRVARPPERWVGPIYLQPMDAQDDVLNARNRAACVASCLEYGYILQLQVHKILGME